MMAHLKLKHPMASADEEQLPGKPAGLMRRQEDDDIRHILRKADASKWD